MKVIIGSDHGGFELKEDLKAQLADLKIEVVDVGTNSETAVDYPDFGRAVADPVSSGKFDRGILICGTGIGSTNPQLLETTAASFSKAKLKASTSADSGTGWDTDPYALGTPSGVVDLRTGERRPFCRTDGSVEGQTLGKFRFSSDGLAFGLRAIAGSLRQDPQPQHLRQPKRIVLVIGML